MAIDIFQDDDVGYRTWMYANPSGYVVNAERNPKPGYLVLHTAMCDTISPAPDKAWTDQYIKICSMKRFELDAWARGLGGRLSECSFCEP